MPRSWSPDEILTLARSYQGACVLAAGAEHDVFAVLGDGPRTAADVAQRIDGDRRATTILLDALTALQLVEKTDDRYGVDASVAGALTTGGADSVLAMVRHQASCMRRWARLGEVVRTGEPVPRWPSVRGEAGDEESFIEAMHDINRTAAAPLIEEIGPIPFTRLLDIGGGPGTWTIAWLQANPDAQATIFDLPHVLPLAERHVAAAGLADRVSLVAGDFEIDPLPPGADLAWVSAIIHQNAREQNLALFGAVADALTEGGRILIRDIVMAESRVEPPGGAMFAVNMLAATAGGATFTFREIREDLEASGFDHAEFLREDPWMSSIVSAEKKPA